MQKNEPAMWFFDHLDASIGIPRKQGPYERLLMDRKYGESWVIQIFCHLFVMAPVSNPRLDRPTVVFFQIQDSQEMLSFSSFMCPSVFCLPMWTRSLCAHVFLIRFYNKVKELCILALMGRVAQPHCCKLL